jgi:hypothetical protein
MVGRNRKVELLETQSTELVIQTPTENKEPVPQIQTGV